MNSNQRDRKILRMAAGNIRRDLNSRARGTGFRASQKLPLFGSYTDGWYIRLGRARHPGLDLELWLDRYPRSTNSARLFWFGFRTTQPPRMRYLTKRLPRHLQPVRRLRDSDYEKVSPGVWLLKRFFTEFNKPVSEAYYKYRLHYYGIYPGGRRSTTLPIGQVARRAADFFSEVLWLLKKAPEAERNQKVYPQLEREVVRRHLVRERSRELSLACKQRDGFRCRVCRMTFAEVYGEELGAEFAESHHLHPLSRKRAGKKTRLEDLATVCANCHRMLHLMKGREHDVEELRRRFIKRRYRERIHV